MVNLVYDLLVYGDKAIVMDPIVKPGTIRMIKILAEPMAMIMVNHSHLRGFPFLLRQLNFPLFIPDIKTVDESEELLDTFVNLYNMGDDIQYKESTDLPFGIKAYSIGGRHEMALKFGDFLVVSDSAYGIEGKLAFDPTGIHPDENSAKSNATAFALVPIIKKTMAR